MWWRLYSKGNTAAVVISFFDVARVWLKWLLASVSGAYTEVNSLRTGGQRSEYKIPQPGFCFIKDPGGPSATWTLRRADATEFIW